MAGGQKGVSLGAGVAPDHALERSIHPCVQDAMVHGSEWHALVAKFGPLLAHGATGSNEMLFRFGEALAAAGFECYSVDQAGHG